MSDEATSVLLTAVANIEHDPDNAPVESLKQIVSCLRQMRHNLSCDHVARITFSAVACSDPSQPLVRPEVALLVDGMVLS
jgi:hypothetical protein